MKKVRSPWSPEHALRDYGATDAEGLRLALAFLAKAGFSGNFADYVLSAKANRDALFARMEPAKEPT